jgi:hypothetical protein
VVFYIAFSEYQLAAIFEQRKSAQNDEGSRGGILPRTLFGLTKSVFMEGTIKISSKEALIPLLSRSFSFAQKHKYFALP